jgi:glycosyltransferase domain-containing protein
MSQNPQRHNSLSIIIPTYERPFFLKRLLYYYKSKKCPFEILVADSSHTDGMAKNREIVRSVQDTLNIRHAAFPSEINFTDKAIQSYGLTQSHYVTICADDDFIIPEALEECTVFLDNNPDYSVVRGRTIFFEIHPNKLTLGDYPQRSLELTSPHLRLQSHLMQYTTTIYGVHRYEPNFRILELTKQHTDENVFIELLQSCLNVVQGKVKCLDLLYSVRQAHSGRVTVTERPWTKLLSSQEWLTYLSRFKTCLAEELSLRTNIRFDVAEQLVHQAFMSYLSSPQMIHTLAEVFHELGAPTFEAAAGMVINEVLPKLWGATPKNLEPSVVNSLEPQAEKERKAREMELSSLLSDNSPYFAEFLPIFGLLTCYPEGISE